MLHQNTVELCHIKENIEKNWRTVQIQMAGHGSKKPQCRFLNAADPDESEFLQRHRDWNCMLHCNVSEQENVK